jgi:prepilin-type N-terminal cleavage/methylation domain-containing protein
MPLDRSRRADLASRRGFTLVEVLLAVALMSLFTGAAIVSFGTIGQGAELNLGAVRFEGMLRFARAEAANSGRRVRVSIVPDSPVATAPPITNQASQIRLAWEPKPFDQPEVFEDLPPSQWGADHLTDNIAIQTVRLIDPNDTASAIPTTNTLATADEIEAPQASQATAPPAITFNPDGSSDSAEIVLTARNPDDSRRIAVRIEGLTGSISRSVISDEPCAGSDGYQPAERQGASVVVE